MIQNRTEFISKIRQYLYKQYAIFPYFKSLIEILDNVSPESFIPKPKVESVILKLTPKKNINFYSKNRNNR